MAKIYSDEEIERLSENPCVNYVCRNKLSLKLEFKQQLYDIWVQKPVASTIKKLLQENGFDTRELGKDFYKNISKAFKYYGRPKSNHDPASNAENVKFHAVLEMPEEDKKVLPDCCPDFDKPGIGRITVNDALVHSRKFVMDGETINITPDYVSVLFSSYPQTSVYEALSRDGFFPWVIGMVRIRRLEEMFSACLSAGTAPYESRDKNCLLDAEEVAAARRNPFVETATPLAICMREGFRDAAAALQELATDRILDIFMVGHRNFTLPEKAMIKELLITSSPDEFGTSVFGSTVYDACILRRRLAALEGLAKEGFHEISELVPMLRPYQKKQVCLWVKGLPPDPGHVFTRKEILHQIGIARSVYYQYAGDPDFGMGEIHKKEKDEADARLVKMVIDYKSFRKGSRQIYMLLPRLTGRHISLKKIRRIMKTYGMECGIRRHDLSSRGRKAYEEGAVKPNLLRRRFRLYRPNKGNGVRHHYLKSLPMSYMKQPAESSMTSLKSISVVHGNTGSAGRSVTISGFPQEAIAISSRFSPTKIWRTCTIRFTKPISQNLRISLMRRYANNSKTLT